MLRQKVITLKVIQLVDDKHVRLPDEFIVDVNTGPSTPEDNEHHVKANNFQEALQAFINRLDPNH